MTQSKAQQETTIGEGLAVGAAMLGIEGVEGSKPTLEFDFRSAWRSWSYASKFPAVQTGPNADNVFHILRRSSRRATPHLAAWSESWPYAPVILVDWPLPDVADAVDEDVPGDAWAELVGAWLRPVPPA